ncbi:hypothetical protein B005_2602 [Nocardiopsis alba ATCC BAA-2165]|uniref:Uncharacterized protein n=2 Tax=Nocardiopsis alba TaxID=53437 RepID=J7LD94_NOCAA|nr:hypothetical protein B005_2602 [Nocardiopsis alba ATCC BAA-2165]
MRFELVSSPDRPKEREEDPYREAARHGRSLVPGDKTRAALMAERSGALGDRITSLSHSLRVSLGRLDENIARHERERPEHHAVEQAPPPDNFRAHRFSGGGDR